MRLSWWTARKLKKLLESKDSEHAWNAWYCLHCRTLRTFKNVGVFCMQQKEGGSVTYYLEGICTVSDKKCTHIINKSDLATAGVRLNLQPRLVPPKPPPETFIDAKIKKSSETKRFGGKNVTGFGISPAVAQLMQEKWPTMADFAAVKRQDLTAWRTASSVHPSVAKLWLAATEMKKHLDSQARPKSSPVKSPAHG